MENTISSGPDQEILGYLHASYTREYQVELVNALALLYQLEYPDLQEQLVNAINDPEADEPEAVSSLVNSLINEALDKMFVLWHIELSEEVPLAVKNAIATALAQVVVVEDPVPYLRILETDLDPIEKLARIVEGFTTVKEIAVLDAVLDIGDSLLDRLYAELEKLEKRTTIEDTVSEVNPKHLDYFQKFCQYIGKDHLGYQMLTNDFRFGLEAAAYLTYVKPLLDSGVLETTARDILSYYLLAVDTWEAPVEAFRRNSEMLLKNPRDILAVETQMRSLLERFNQFKVTLNESA